MQMKIVAIDDDPAFLTILEIMFRRYKHIPIELTLFCDSNQALEYVKDSTPDVILLDIFMPKLNGWEVLQQLVSANISTSVYILSSSVDKNDMEKARNYTLVKEFISKPLTYDKLKSLIPIN